MNPFTAIRQRWSETVSELKKSSWPNRRELWESTLVVLIGIVLLGTFIFLADFSLNNWVKFLTGLVR